MPTEVAMRIKEAAGDRSLLEYVTRLLEHEPDHADLGSRWERLRREVNATAADRERAAHFMADLSADEPERRASPPGVVLDAGLFAALERRAGWVTEMVDRWLRDGTGLATSANVIAQVWHGGTDEQLPTSVVLHHTEVLPLDLPTAKALSLILGVTGSVDLAGAHLALIAGTRGWPVLTSDADRFEGMHPALRIGVI